MTYGRIHETSIERQDASSVHRLPPSGRAKTIATVRALVNKHIRSGYDECLVWGTIGWTIPLSRYPDTYNKQPICYVALSCGQEARHGGSVVFILSRRTIAARSHWQADLSDFKREVDRDVRTITLDDQGGAGAEGKARRNIVEKRAARKVAAKRVATKRPRRS
jgi:hypothetical protein